MRAARETLPLRRGAAAPTPSSATSSRWRPPLAGELAGVPVATLIPHVDPRFEPRLAAVLDRRAAAAHGARAAALWRRVRIR